MLQPSVVTVAVVSAWQSLPELVVQMNSKPENIIAHNYAWGSENSLAKAITDMPAPSILVAYQKIQGGNFSGDQIWKHYLQVVIKSGNVADTSVPTLSTPDIWWLMMNGKINGGPDTIRMTSLLGGSLMPMTDLPTLAAQQDEMGDFFVGTLILPEYGDVGVYEQ